MAKVYKNLILSNSNILFDLNTRKIYSLDKNHVDEFTKLANGKQTNFESDFPVGQKDISKMNLDINTIKINMCNCCNLKCKYCFANEGTYNHKSQFISRETCDNILKFIGQNPTVEYVTFFGGEPFLNYKLIQYMCEKIYKEYPHVKFLIQTNGTIMNDEIRDIIKKYNLQITLSIDGAEEDNNRNRIYKNGKGTFRNIVSNFIDLKQYIVAIEATWDGKSTVSKLEISKYLYSLFNCDRISICDLFGSKKKFENMNLELNEILENPYYANNELKKFISNFVSKKENSSFCSAGSGLLQIDVDGSIYPCHLLIEKKDKYCLGNVNKIDLDYLLQKRELFLNNMKKDNEKCRNCFNRWNCSPCFAENEGINYSSCEEFKKRTLDSFDLLGEEIEKNHFNNLLKSIERTIVYV